VPLRAHALSFSLIFGLVFLLKVSHVMGAVITATYFSMILAHATRAGAMERGIGRR